MFYRTVQKLLWQTTGAERSKTGNAGAVETMDKMRRSSCDWIL